MRRAAMPPILLLLALALAGCSVFGGKAAEEPAYEVERVSGDNHIRAYAGYAIAKTTAPGSRDEATRTGFLRLFDYITGDNKGAAEIAMTAPVLTEPEGAEIAMTAPVLIDEQATGWQVVFVLPEGMTAETAPAPSSPEVAVEDVVPRRVAVRAFAGWLTPEKAAYNRGRLADWLEGEGIAHEGDWRTAGYHPPWTIPWLRRYEVWVTLK
ncbi:MAG: heme-binding protein [Pseudomonadota bacterium]